MKVTSQQSQRVYYFVVAAILVLSKAPCSSVVVAFAPILAAVRSPSDLASKPYFANFSTEKVNDRPNDFSSANNASDQIGLGKTAIVAGGTGYIGRACVRECVHRGYNTIALVRDTSRAHADEALNGASLVECDVTNEMQVQSLFKEIANGKHFATTETNELENGKRENGSVDMVISCLASAAGIESEVYSIDYQATLNLLNAGRDPSVSARHFVLLSAFCCRNPILKLQQAKLEFEKKLAEQSEMSYSIVRPTAFFKSVSGQYESILQGNSYVLFGAGAETRCNPIAAEELATYMCDSSLEKFKDQRWGKILNIGGPDAPLTNKMLGEMMFKVIDKPAKFVYVPTQVFDFSISLIEFVAKNWPSQKWDDVLETAKIGKYYAVEDMLTTDEEEKFGSISMMDHFEKIGAEGQDPFTPVRATSLISKVLEALPVISVSIPLGFGLLFKTDLLDKVMTSNSWATMPMLVTGLNDHIIS